MIQLKSPIGANVEFVQKLIVAKKSTVLHSATLELLLNLLHNPKVKFLCIIFILFWGSSVEGVRSGIPWTGLYCSPWTWSVVGNRGPGIIVFGLPLG